MKKLLLLPILLLFITCSPQKNLDNLLQLFIKSKIQFFELKIGVAKANHNIHNIFV